MVGRLAASRQYPSVKCQVVKTRPCLFGGHARIPAKQTFSARDDTHSEKNNSRADVAQSWACTFEKKTQRGIYVKCMFEPRLRTILTLKSLFVCFALDKLFGALQNLFWISRGSEKMANAKSRVPKTVRPRVCLPTRTPSLSDALRYSEEEVPLDRRADGRNRLRRASSSSGTVIPKPDAAFFPSRKYLLEALPPHGSLSSCQRHIFFLRGEIYSN